MVNLQPATSRSSLGSECFLWISLSGTFWSRCDSADGSACDRHQRPPGRSTHTTQSQQTHTHTLPCGRRCHSGSPMGPWGRVARMTNQIYCRCALTLSLRTDGRFHCKTSTQPQAPDGGGGGGGDEVLLCCALGQCQEEPMCFFGV